MPFGLCNAPSTFQALMNKIFRPYLGKFVLIYVDDIMVMSRSLEEHEDHLAKVLQVLKDNELYVKLSKCDFQKQELKFLGHIVSGDGVKVDPAKTSVVRDWPTPTSVTHVRAFLGLCNYFRKFLQGYTTMVLPLIRLTRKDVLWGPDTWTPACQAAFEQVKQALTEAPTLALPDFANPMEMEVICDASTGGIGAVLTQFGRPLAFESKKLTDAEKNWTTTDQELWAVIHALKIWRCYLEGINFTVVTDHNPLVHLQSQPTLSRRQARWAEYLQRFTFAWQYRPGKGNVADPLSRLPLTTAALKVTRAAAEANNLPPPPPPSVLGKRQRRPSVRFADPSDPVVVTRPQPSPAITSPKPRGRRRGPSKMQTLPVLPDSEIGTSLSHPEPFDWDLSLLQKEYASDPWFSFTKNTGGLVSRNGIWYQEWKNSKSPYYQPRVVIPDVPWIKKAILHELHNAAYSGHCGEDKTLEAVSRLVWWPYLRRDIKDYLATCEACQRNKASNQKPAGLLNPLPIPENPWDSVSMDFITGLPLTPRKHDAILVVVDRLTKMTHVIPTTTTVDATETARLFVDNVWKHHGLPLDVVSDRGSVFVGTFFSELLRILGTRHKRSTAFHPQTDGQTERVNRVLEDMIRHYVMGMDGHLDWDLHLSAAEFAINNSFHVSIGTTPFRLNYGRDPRLPLSLFSGIGPPRVPAAAAFADRMATGLVAAKKHLQAAQQRQKRYADLHRREVSFTVGDQVLLSTANIHLRHTDDTSTSNKLLPRWVGPFPVVKTVGSVAYKVDLPASWKIHPVFHVSLLKPYRSDGRVQPPQPLVVDGELYFFIEKILDHRVVQQGRRTVREYFLQWKGYGPVHNSWEPEKLVAESENGATLKAYWKSAGFDSPPA